MSQKHLQPLNDSREGLAALPTSSKHTKFPTNFLIIQAAEHSFISEILTRLIHQTTMMMIVGIKTFDLKSN